MPLFPKLPRREFRYTPLSSPEGGSDLRQRLQIRPLVTPRSRGTAVVKWGLLLALALAIYEYLHGDPLARWLQPRTVVGLEDELNAPADSARVRP
ncbi:MAG: hypothetical protein WC326_06815 [Candidatus Delongbacteria bacterium]